MLSSPLAPWLLVLSGLCGSAAGTPAYACSIGSGVWEKDFAQAIRSNSQVFVARLLGYREAPPAKGEDFYLNQVDYVVVEVIKGQPDSAGTLSERNPYHTMSGRPGPSCGPWLVLPGAMGATAVVFATPERRDGKPYLWVDPFSRRLEPGDPPSDEMLQLIRNLERESDTQ